MSITGNQLQTRTPYTDMHMLEAMAMPILSVKKAALA